MNQNSSLSLFCAKTREYYLLTGIHAFIWSLIDGKRTKEAILEELAIQAPTFSVEMLDDFLNKLIQSSLITKD